MIIVYVYLVHDFGVFVFSPTLFACMIFNLLMLFEFDYQLIICSKHIYFFDKEETSYHLPLITYWYLYFKYFHIEFELFIQWRINLVAIERAIFLDFHHWSIGVGGSPTHETNQCSKYYTHTHFSSKRIVMNASLGERTSRNVCNGTSKFSSYMWNIDSHEKETVS